MVEQKKSEEQTREKKRDKNTGRRKRRGEMEKGEVEMKEKKKVEFDMEEKGEVALMETKQLDDEQRNEDVGEEQTKKREEETEDKKKKRRRKEWGRVCKERDLADEKRKQRSRVLAERRMSVLKSLQGLVTSTRNRTHRKDINQEERDDKRDEKEAMKREQTEEPSKHKEDEDGMDKQRIPAPALSVTDSLLYRLHGDIRISMTLEKPDVNKCLSALDELSSVSVSSRHIQNHSELIDTLRKMRWFRGSEAIMFKASMLYYRFKNIYLIGEPDDTLSPEYIHSLQEERETAGATHTSYCCSGGEPHTNQQSHPTQVL
ncbi:PC4 and SFRS1-interacting protein-like isoform X2 [Silurus meridionalis]|uniref:PC4 and SFRS1-interacting protein-like isoform X2 n=1 Tax=Silurus meridionalis TaxID=175797 RepID=UPI001EECE406|nr:PC4 and SFRS1-interacting protein-like isoform X2 [Silurus meridionalis]